MRKVCLLDPGDPATLLKYFGGLAAGADGVELDVHPTLDGHVVVIHDATQDTWQVPCASGAIDLPFFLDASRKDRTTNGTGLVCRASLDEIRRLDAGAKHSAAFRGERVPLLSEAVADRSRLGKMKKTGFYWICEDLWLRLRCVVLRDAVFSRHL